MLFHDAAPWRARLRPGILALLLIAAGSACERTGADAPQTSGAVVLDPDLARRGGGPDRLALGERLPAFDVAYEAPDGRFSVRFPRRPRVDRQLLETPSGNVELVTVACDYSVVKAYWASYSEYPSAYVEGRDAGVILDEARASVVRNLGERTVFSVLGDTVRQGYPAQRFRARDGHFHADYELVLAGNRLYQLGVLRDGAYPPAADVRAFLDGFRLHDGG